MAKKSSIVKATNSIAPTGGCGPFMAREIMHGSKPMSRKHGKIDTKGGSAGGASGSVVKTTNHIAGIKGKGPLMASQIMDRERPMCREKGVVKPRANNNMDINSGGYRIGSGVRTFRRGLLGPAGPASFGQKKQPGGHGGM